MNLPYFLHPCTYIYTLGLIWITNLVSCFSNFHSSVNCSRFILHINLHAFPYFILLSCLCPGPQTGPNFILLRTLKTGLDHLKFMFSGSDLWLLTQDKHILIISNGWMVYQPLHFVLSNWRKWRGRFSSNIHKWY